MNVFLPDARLRTPRVVRLGLPAAVIYVGHCDTLGDGPGAPLCRKIVCAPLREDESQKDVRNKLQQVSALLHQIQQQFAS